MFFLFFSPLFLLPSKTASQYSLVSSRFSVFRRVVNYYSDDPTGLSGDGEDAFDMRKPLSRDKELKHIREKGEEFLVQPEDVY
jgi:N-terminal acetyltransferase B complex catalytic subunit